MRREKRGGYEAVRCNRDAGAEQLAPDTKPEAAAERQRLSRKPVLTPNFRDRYPLES